MKSADTLTRYSDALREVVTTVRGRFRVLPAGVHLEPVNDAFPVISVAGCEIEQLALYTDWGDVLVDHELYDFLQHKNHGNTDLAALFAHESLYALMRAVKMSPNSKDARRIVGALFSEERTKNPFLLYSLFSDAFPYGDGRLAWVRGGIPSRDASVLFALGATFYTNDGIKHETGPVRVKYDARLFEPSTGKRTSLKSGTCTSSAESFLPCGWLDLSGGLADGVFLEVEVTLLEQPNGYPDLALQGAGGVNALTTPFRAGSANGTHTIFTFKPWQR